MTTFSRFLKDESGATAIEYGLIAAIVGVGIIAGLGTLQEALDGIFNTVSDELNSAGQ
jgi:pilus assembly protein Flp/PilA